MNNFRKKGRWFQTLDALSETFFVSKSLEINQICPCDNDSEHLYFLKDDAMSQLSVKHQSYRKAFDAPYDR